MTEEPQHVPPTEDELVAACRAAHQKVCQALKALQTPDEYDVEIEIAQLVGWLGQAASALSRYIEAHASDQAPPVRETESRCTSGWGPVGEVPEGPEVSPIPMSIGTGTDPRRDQDDDGGAGGEAAAAQPT